MNRAAVLKSGVGMARYRLTGHRLPLSVHLTVTHRCTALCATCAIPLRPAGELETRAWMAIIDEAAQMGAVRFEFAGGEPLVRDDIGALVDRAAAHGAWTTLETNGALYPARADELARLGRLVVALDGDEEAHDALREPGSWRQATAAIALAASRGVDLRTTTTLTARNLHCIDTVLDLADAHGFVADFQVLQGAPFLSPARFARLSAARDDLRRALRHLLEARVAGRRVAPTEKYLRYLLTWPDYARPTSDAPHEDLHCLAGHLYCAVDADGSVTPCPLLSGRHPSVDVRALGFSAAFEALRDNPCRACTSTSLTEYNYLCNLNAPSLLERVKAVMR